MAFDRDNLKPLYRLEMGESGDSCALYIARRLGLPDDMLTTAANATYGEKSESILTSLFSSPGVKKLKTKPSPSIEKKKPLIRPEDSIYPYQRGDSVTVLPDNIIGIVVKPADRQGNVLVQLSTGALSEDGKTYRKEKQLISHKRLKLKVAAKELYPEDYDFSIIFDTVQNRKARHKMGKHHEEGLMIQVEEY